MVFKMANMGPVNLVLILCISTVIYFYLDTKWSALESSDDSTRPCGTYCNEKDSQYLINTPGCTIPDFPLDEILKNRRKMLKGFVCSKKRVLTEEKGQHLFFYKDRVVDYNMTIDTLNCTYQGIGVVGRKTELKEVLPLVENKMPISEDGIAVTCYNSSQGNNTMVYQNVHYFIQQKRIEKKRRLFKEKYGSRSEHPEKLSVLMLGIDGVARYNSIRQMPHFYQYLTEELGGLDFRGYTKIGENTLPNTLAMVVGHTHTELNEHECLANKKIKNLDDCPLVWKDFASEGYVTAYGEDISSTNIFTYKHHGFHNEPVDFYPWHSIRQAIRRGGHGIYPFRGFQYPVCAGPRLLMSVLHDYSLAMAEECRDVPYFSFLWSSSLTHDHFRMPRVVDGLLLRVLTQLHNDGHLNNTVVFLVSDHGLRYGPYRHTYMGRMEEKLPFFYTVFPPWFKKVYPVAWKNLITNTKRLTSNLDIYETLKSLANGDFVTNTRRPASPRRGQSLFFEVPESRICSDVSIPENFCACEMSITASIADPKVIAAAEAAIIEINLSMKIFSDCVPLRLDKVMSARLVTPSNSTQPGSMAFQIFTYVLEFQTQPGGAMLELKMRKQGNSYTMVGEALRTNLYGNQSHCIKHYMLRKYCFCRDLLHPKEPDFSRHNTTDASIHTSTK
ncbi:uncharacterized protein LOC121869958 isoform X2 [Homarus americanus]|uniref:uncharacterized protein LOC121869958 isoform X2 n=1 Tax=Homarus americanus TaxID=6706 RepID=UPI001C446BCC|nr:uncharacterized protein LOC121869958 isoform X2 [Homarus americanus]